MEINTNTQIPMNEMTMMPMTPYLELEYYQTVMTHFESVISSGQVDQMHILKRSIEILNHLMRFDGDDDDDIKNRIKNIKDTSIRMWAGEYGWYVEFGSISVVSKIW